MHTVVDDTLRNAARELAFRHFCEDCAHFDPERRLCAEGYPNAAHRTVRLETVSEIVFCKSFELF